MADSKVFNLAGSGVKTADAAQALVFFFEDKKGLVSEVVETPQGVIVQAKAQDTWKKFVGMDSSLQVQFIDQGDSMIVNIGTGKWIDKAGAAAVGAFVFAPLLITAAIGAWANKKMPDEIFAYIETFIITGGKRSAVSINARDAVSSSDVVCPKCRTKNTAGTKFCNSCGTKLVVECAACGAVVSPGTKFCNSCGANIAEQLQKSRDDSVVKCAQCGSVITGGAKFCPECGAPAPIKLDEGTTACPKCRKILPEGTKFCPDCGETIPVKKIPTCPKCGVEVKEGMKFCTECGTAL
ncbi:hypothetical protein FACS1894167_04040 [Synergistales bacterium]|nr:hypothetical protein FACS1894167_04040 [Synergistales bacterium]